MTLGPAANAASGPLRTRRSRLPVPEALPESFYERDAAAVARDLLGAVLVSEVDGKRCLAEIVETEAYIGPEDAASHAHIRLGRTERNRVMFGPPGRAYVYRIYGLHWCLNAVTGAAGYPAAVLIRAAQPLHGAEWIASRRPGRPERDWLRGPGNLSRGLGIDARLNDHPLDDCPLWIMGGRHIAETALKVGPRIGITRAADWPLRFWIAGNRWVSKEPLPQRTT